eukprot:COSAG01_NODE_3686_length_5796_cov_13.667720_3_plen_184_part_00
MQLQRCGRVLPSDPGADSGGFFVAIIERLRGGVPIPAPAPTPPSPPATLMSECELTDTEAPPEPPPPPPPPQPQPPLAGPTSLSQEHVHAAAPAEGAVAGEDGAIEGSGGGEGGRTASPGMTTGAGGEVREGDWHCSACGEPQLAPTPARSSILRLGPTWAQQALTDWLADWLAAWLAAWLVA